MDASAFNIYDLRNSKHTVRNGFYGITRHLGTFFMQQPLFETSLCYDCYRLHPIDCDKSWFSLTLEEYSRPNICINDLKSIELHGHLQFKNQIKTYLSQSLLIGMKTQ